MSTHNICFCGEIRKVSAFFGWKKCLICYYGWTCNLLITFQTRIQLSHRGRHLHLLRQSPAQLQIRRYFQLKSIGIFLPSPQKCYCMLYLLIVPHWGVSNAYPQDMFLWRNKKNSYLVLPLIWSYITIRLQGLARQFLLFFSFFAFHYFFSCVEYLCIVLSYFTQLWAKRFKKKQIYPKYWDR